MFKMFVEVDGKKTEVEIEADKLIMALIRHNDLDDYGCLSPYYYNALAYLIRCGCKENFESDINKAIWNLKRLISME